MRSTSDHFKVAKNALHEQLLTLPLDITQKRALSNKIAKFAAAAVREDRVHRSSFDSLAKLCDVFFNGREA